MDTITAIEKRRSIKSFDSDHQMSEAEEQKLLNLAMLSPTAFNIQNWRFLLVKDPELRKKIREVSWDQAQVTDSSLLIVMCADLKAWQKDPARYWKNAPQEVADFLVPAIGDYYTGRDQVQQDEAMRSCGMAAQTIMLAAQQMGYDCCPMDGFDFEKVGELVNLPKDHVISMFVAVGKAIQPAWPRGGQIDYSEAVVVDKF